MRRLLFAFLPGALAVLAVAIGSTAVADTVVIAPPADVATNVLSVFSGATALDIAGPGVVRLNPANAHTGGTTLSGGTLEITGNVSEGGYSPVGAGALTVAGGVLRGSGSFARNIEATGEATIEAPGGWTWTGTNTFDGNLSLESGTLEIADGKTTLSNGFQFSNESGETISYVQTGGEVVLGVSNLQLARANGTSSSFTMTGGSFDGGGKNATVYGGVGGKSVMNISGAASARNFGVIYVHKNTSEGSRHGSLSVNVIDGGTLGFKTTEQNNYAPKGSFTMNIDGGTIVNESTETSAFSWIVNLNSFCIGAKGVTFQKQSAASGVAQLCSPMQAADGIAGESAGVTFDGGAWGYYVAGNSYTGPTTLKNKSILFLYPDGTIPAGSVVTVGPGSRLSVGGAAKTVSSLVLEEGAILGFGTSANALTVSESIELPLSAKIALYSTDGSAVNAKTDNGTYAVLNVPAAYADALESVRWSPAVSAAGKIYSFSVAVSGSAATLSVTIADAPDTTGDFTVGSGESLALSGKIEVGIEDGTRSIVVDGGVLSVGDSLTGFNNGGSVVVKNGGFLDVARYMYCANSTSTRYDVYVQSGGKVRVRYLYPASANAGNVSGALHIDGGTIMPYGEPPGDDQNNQTHCPRYISTLVGAGGATMDLSSWAALGATGWHRINCRGKFDHDSGAGGTDGGLDVIGGNGDQVLFLFHSDFAGSTMNGGIRAHEGVRISASGTGLASQSLHLMAGSFFKSYNNTTAANVGNLSIGAAGETAPVEICLNSAATVPAIVVTDSLQVFSPVTFDLASNWNKDPQIVAGTYTALVYKAESSTIDTSLFGLRAGAAGYTLSLEKVELTDGDYSGMTALVATIDGALELKDAETATIDGDRSYENVYIGDFETTSDNPKLTVESGNVAINGTLHLAYMPYDSNSGHECIYIQNGGSVKAENLISMYRGDVNSARGRADASVTLNGGTLDIAGDVMLGHNRTRAGRTTTITVNDGAMTVGDNMYLTYYNKTANAPQGIIVMKGGSLDVGGYIDLSRCVNQTTLLKDGGVFLHGGVLSATNIQQGNSEAKGQRLVFDGGTFAPTAANTMSGLTTANVAGGGCVIDTSRLPSGATYTIAQTLATDPALDGAKDGGLVKKGSGTLALGGANTYNGATVVEGGTLAVGSADAISDAVSVAEGAFLDLGGNSVSIASIRAGGVVVNGSLTVTGTVSLDGGAPLSVAGDLAIGSGAAIDFGLQGSEALDANNRVPVAAASGTVSAPEHVKALNAGSGVKRVALSLEGGVLYARPQNGGLMVILR